MAFLWVVVMRGGRKPLVVEVTSNIADGLILDVETPMPTWAIVETEILEIAISNSNLIFFISKI